MGQIQNVSGAGRQISYGVAPQTVAPGGVVTVPDSLIAAYTSQGGTWQQVGVTSAYVASPGDVVLADATAGPLTITLPPVASVGPCVVKKIDTTASAVTVVPFEQSLSTSLASAVTSPTSTAVTLAAALPVLPANGAPFQIVVDSEHMLVTAGFGTTNLTVTRGYAGTTAATHLVNAAVTVYIPVEAAASVVLSSAGQAVSLVTSGGAWSVYANNQTGGGGGSSTLAGDSDVAIASPATNQALLFNGTKWANTTLGSAAFQPTTAFDAAGAANTAQSASLQKTANLSDVTSAATSRTNLGAATDTAVVHLASSETITGPKTFNAGTFLDKGSQVFDVKAYGAKGDGTTDDTAAINSAVAAVNSGGGMLYFPTGTYLVTAKLTNLASNVTVAGNGASSVLLMAYSFNGFQMMQTAAASSGITFQSVAFNAQGWSSTSTGAVTLSGTYSVTTAASPPAGLPASGFLDISTAANGIQTIAYSSYSGSTFTCTGGTGAAVSGAAVGFHINHSPAFVFLNGVTGFTMTGCVAQNGPADLLSTSTASSNTNILVSENMMSNMAGSLLNGHSGTITNLTVIDNIVDGGFAAYTGLGSGGGQYLGLNQGGIQLYGSTNQATISRNTIKNIGVQGQVGGGCAGIKIIPQGQVNGAGVLISDNTIVNVSGLGMSMNGQSGLGDGLTRVSLTGNSLSFCGSNGIDCNNVVDLLISANRCMFNGSTNAGANGQEGNGILINGCTQFTATGNICGNNSRQQPGNRDGLRVGSANAVSQYGQVTGNLCFDEGAGRADISSTTSGSATIGDNQISLQDQGKFVSGPGIPANAYVGPVISGASYTLVTAAGANLNATATAASVTLTVGGPRTDTVTAAGTTTVTDSNCVASDVNMPLAGAGIAAGAYVVSVTPGTSFVASTTVPNTTTSVTVGGASQGYGININNAVAQNVRLSGNNGWGSVNGMVGNLAAANNCINLDAAATPSQQLTLGADVAVAATTATTLLTVTLGVGLWALDADVTLLQSATAGNFELAYTAGTATVTGLVSTEGRGAVSVAATAAITARVNVTAAGTINLVIYNQAACTVKALTAISSYPGATSLTAVPLAA